MLFAAACNRSGEGANNPGGGGIATLDFLYAGTQEILELYTALVNEYNATQGKEDRIRVMGMPIPVGSVNDKLTNVLPSSNGPDVVIGTDEYFKPHTKNMLDISDAFSSELLGSLYERQEIRYHYDAENITANESDPLYALPSVNDPTVLYYNKDALKAAGVICISVDEKDLAAFNAGTYMDLNGMKKFDITPLLSFYDKAADICRDAFRREAEEYSRA